MRPSLFYNPRLLCERLAIASQRLRRFAKLKYTPAARLKLGHIDSLELLELVRPLGVGVIYDIGANIGTWTLLAKAILPAATIEAFEPLELHCQRFEGCMADMAQVSLHHIALGAENGEAVVKVTEFSDASSLLTLSERSKDEQGMREQRTERVPLFRLDDYILQKNLLPPELIKLDVQGFELEVFKGATHALATAKAIITEVSFVEFYTKQCLFHDIVGFLASEGFHLCAFGVNTPTGALAKQTDVLFVRRGLV